MIWTLTPWLEGGVCLGVETTWPPLNPGLHFHAMVYWSGDAGGGAVSMGGGGLAAWLTSYTVHRALWATGTGMQFPLSVREEQEH